MGYSGLLWGFVAPFATASVGIYKRNITDIILIPV